MPNDGGVSQGRLTNEQALQCEFVRDIFGNPFRPVEFDPRWRTSTTVDVARHMYDSRTFEVMPVLADALQDAECNNVFVLGHCHRSGPHVRGCWVLDSLLSMK
jgi:hypothetical protein